MHREHEGAFCTLPEVQGPLAGRIVPGISRLLCLVSVAFEWCFADVGLRH